MVQRSLLVFEAHADDFELFAMSLLSLFDPVDVICVTRAYEPSRSAEFAKAAKALGYTAHTWNVADGCAKDHSLGTDMCSAIRNLRPYAVATHDPWKPYLLHADHRAVGTKVCDAITRLRANNAYIPTELWLWNAGYANRRYRVAPETRAAAVSYYQSQPFLQTAHIPSVEEFRQILLTEDFG